MMRWLLLVALAATPALAEALFEARPLTPAGEYTFGIEGPAVDADGNPSLASVYVMPQREKRKIETY